MSGFVLGSGEAEKPRHELCPRVSSLTGGWGWRGVLLECSRISSVMELNAGCCGER